MSGSAAFSPSDLMNTQQAAEYALCSESTIKRAVYDKKLSAMRRGRRYYFHREDLDAMFQPVMIFG